MTQFVKITDGVVVQRQPYSEAGFVEASEGVMCGMIWDGEAFNEPAAPALPSEYRLYKSTLIRRLSEQEAVALAVLLDGSPVKSRMLWDASEWLGSDDPLFATLQQAIGTALGPDRAAEILAP